MKKRRPAYVVANFKMNPDSPAKAKAIVKSVKAGVRKYSSVQVVIAPSLPHLSALSSLLTTASFSLGAQNVFYEQNGAYTGEVSATMLKNEKVRYVIVGHSERRTLGENNSMVNKKALSVVSNGMNAIVCIGEGIRDRAGAYLDFLKEEIEQSLSNITGTALKRVLIAYEPIWAIGRGADEAMQPTELHETVLFIRKVLSDMVGKTAAFSIPILYGGSVAPENTNHIITEGAVDGLLVGHASLDPKSFIQIVQAVHDRATTQ